MKKTHYRGSITPAILVMASSFLIVAYGLLALLALQIDSSNRQIASQQALNIAEAGINYYRWHLAHDPLDYYDGTGSPNIYTHQYNDPEGGEIGAFSLEIEEPSDGSSIVTIRSTGWTDSDPNIQRTIEARYGQASLARFSFLQNASSWYGSGITVNGQVHSNNGIRMDGTNTSTVSSAQQTYTCGSETGCSPSTEQPGVWGSGGDQSLWDFPVPAVDFNSISFDFATMRNSAQSGGLYLGDSGARGYHLVFNSNGTFDLRRVNYTSYYYGYDDVDGCQRRYQRIGSETLIGTFSVDDNPIIFAEDYLWVEGDVRGRTNVVAAKFPLETNNVDIWIPDNIEYTTYDGSDVLGLIAQNDIYFARDIPDAFQIDAAMLAQTGKIIRHGYLWWCGGTSQAVKDSLTINGGVISFNKSYWNFGSSPTSGFISREINYDGNLLFYPPPYFPTSGNFELIDWKEI